MNRLQATVVSQCERLPLVAYYSKSRGWPFILSWVHRATGVVLVGYLLLHVSTLSSLAEPAVFEAKMVFYRHLVFSLLEWAIAIPLIFHAFNGGRLILYILSSLKPARPLTTLCGKCNGSAEHFCFPISDYVAKYFLRNLTALITIVVMVACGWAGFKLIIVM